MRITCLITVCAYLSSTVSTDEIQYLNRQRKVRSREESILDDVAARKELNPNTEIRPDVFSSLRKSRPEGQIETFRTYESQTSPQRHPRDRSRRPIKRLKVRSIVGPTYEVNDNEVHEIVHESIPEVHDKGPIYIKPVVRVTTKKNIFDSILDILQQLLDPPKKELGPIVGPIKMPGSKRKIYLRLLEPVDSSHINVRFVTQLPVPVVDEESLLLREHDSTLPFLPSANSDITLFKHPIGSSDATFSSSNRYRSVQLPRNTSHIYDKSRGQHKPAIKLKRPSEALKESEKENVPPVKIEAASGAESDKNHLYYQHQSEDEPVKQVTEIITGATENKQSPKDSLEPWYQLSTHHLPLRQIAPYPLSEYADSDENTYKVPSDSLTASSPHSSSYEQYSNVNAEASGFNDQSSYTIPNTYTTTYQKQNEFNNAPSSYPIAYQNQNEFNNAPSSTSYVKQNDLLGAPATHTSSYKRPANVPSSSSSYATSNEAQNVQTSSQNALRVVDPPLYFLDPKKIMENHINKINNKHTAIQQEPYNLPNVNEIDSMLRNTAQNSELPIDQVIWGKVKREKSESNFQKSKSNFQKNELNVQKSKSNFQNSVEITSGDNRDKWQPLMFVPEDANSHKMFANLAKTANDNRHETIAKQQINRPKQVSRNPTLENKAGKVDQRQNNKRRQHPVASTQNPRCSTSDMGNRCIQKEPTIASTLRPEGAVKIVKEQTQSAANIEPIVITPNSMVSSTEMSISNIVTKSSWIEEPQRLVMTTETLAKTERSPLSIKMIKNTAEKLIENKTKSGSMSGITEKSAASSTTERSLISNTSKAPIARNNTTKRLHLPKRPMIMKKPTFVLKEMELSNTTRKTVASSTSRKPVLNSTMEKTTRRLKFQGALSKSSTT